MPMPKTAIAGLAAAMWAAAAFSSSSHAQNNEMAQALDIQSKQAEFTHLHPGAQLAAWKGAGSAYGKAFSHGPSPVASAEAFRLNSLPVLGLAADELAPYANFLNNNPGGNTLPIMYQPATDNYKFTAVYYTQVKEGYEVFGTKLVVLTRNEADHPAVLANMHLRDLGGFQADPAVAANPNLMAAQRFAKHIIGDEAIFGQMRLVIWAGIDEMVERPALAIEFIGENDNPAAGTYAARRFLADARTGTILYHESLVHDVDIAGNVSGMATDGIGADTCHPEVPMPLPYARVTNGIDTVFTDINGNYVLPNAGAGAINVTSAITGRFFDIFNLNGTLTDGPPTALVQPVTPPGPGDFMHNAANTAEFNRAEVNAYVQANIVRDYLLAYHPTFPTIANELGFDCRVNRNSTCNAFYSSANQSINFYIQGGGCTNTANRTVVHHEYGHRIVNAAGSGQGAYGEGFSDVMAVLVTDQPCLGSGFNAPCGTCLRNADNNCQYATSGCTSNCGSGSHDCGRLISGCVWSVRNNLLVTHPATYRDILSSLTVHSVLLHTGTTITPQITIQFLTLDDDDNDISNGTPHYHQINNGFAAHNMAGPPLNGFTINALPATQSVCAPAEAQYTINIGQVGTVTGAVTLSTTGVPAGATANFSVNPVNIPGSTVLTIGNTNAAATGNYNVNVIGTLNPYLHTTQVGLSVSVAVPGQPSLVSPADGANNVVLLPTLSWSAAPNALSYLLQVSTDAGFGSIVYSATPTTNSHALATALDPLTTYHWRVQADNGCGTSAFSTAFSFHTADIPPILLVDDDNNSPDVRSFYSSALTTAGYTFDIHDVANSTLPEPTGAQMSPYDVIVWFSGDAFGGTTTPRAGPTAASEVALQAWLDAGGCFFLSSQDYLWDRIGSGSTTPNPFMTNYLGFATPIDHDVNYTSVTGQNVYGGFGPYGLIFPSGLSNFADRVDPTPSSQVAFSMPSGGAGVSHDGGAYRTTYLGFPFEAIPDPVQRAAIMTTLLQWCGQLNQPCPPDVNNTGVVDIDDLLAVVGAWGPCPAPCPPDINDSGVVDIDDLLAVIGAWGPCP